MSVSCKFAYCLTGVTLEPGVNTGAETSFIFRLSLWSSVDTRVPSSQGSVCVLFHFLPALHRIRNFPYQGPTPRPLPSGSIVWSLDQQRSPYAFSVTLPLTWYRSGSNTGSYPSSQAEGYLSLLLIPARKGFQLFLKAIVSIAGPPTEYGFAP